MRRPRFDAVRPQELDRLTDKLVEDETVILRWTRLDRPREQWVLDEVAKFQSILDQARAREMERAPQASDYALGVGGFGLAVLGVALMTTPVGVPAALAFGIGGAGSALSIFGGGKVIRQDYRSVQRLLAIDGARDLIEARMRGHNLPPG